MRGAPLLASPNSANLARLAFGECAALDIPRRGVRVAPIGASLVGVDGRFALLASIARIKGAALVCPVVGVKGTPFLASNIRFADVTELALVCGALGGPVWRVARRARFRAVALVARAALGEGALALCPLPRSRVRLAPIGAPPSAGEEGGRRRRGGGFHVGQDAAVPAVAALISRAALVGLPVFEPSSRTAPTFRAAVALCAHPSLVAALGPAVHVLVLERGGNTAVLEKSSSRSETARCIGAVFVVVLAAA